MNVFGDAYASAYDSLYGDKDYAAECDMVEALFDLCGTGPKRRLLDLGCGTGNHAIPLARRGHVVTGIDQSEAMLAQARLKAAAASVSASTAFRHGDVRTVALDEGGFDAAIMMFAVLGYQQTDDDVRAALKTARAHLVGGAPFVFDVWYGPGVISDKPGQRERTIENGLERIIRRTNAILDEERHLCTVQFDLEVWRNGALSGKTHEEHMMRFFFPDELERFAKESGLRLIALRNFPDWRQSATQTSWNVAGIFEAV